MIDNLSDLYNANLPTILASFMGLIALRANVVRVPKS